MSTTSPAVATARRRGRAAAFAAAALVLTGCAGFAPQAGPEPDPPARYVALTTPIIAVGDTQEHEATGFPLHDNDSAVDAYVEVAQRPPEQPLFGRRILEWALASHPGEPFLHLGDLLDMSCRSEAERMRRVLEAEGRQGAILPGNHDGLMFGIYGYDLFAALADRDAERWNRACRRGARADDPTHKSAQEALARPEFIRLYLGGQLAGLAKPGLEVPPAGGEHRVSWRHPDPQAFLSAIEARLLDGDRHADSFIAQRLQLPRAPGAPRRVIVIGLDTNQAGPLVGTWDTLMGRSPGSMGYVRLDQVRAVTPWVLEAARSGDIVVLAGHHNWRALDLPTRLLLRDMMSNLAHPLVYLSAHTHSGFWAVHREIDRRPLLEMNVSSLSDWPIAYRRISLGWDESAQRLLVRAELMPRLPAQAQGAGGDRSPTSYDELLAAWEAQTCGQLPLADASLREADLTLVRRQRDSRGSLLGWLLQSVTPECETCDQPLYEHAQAYQDALLDAVLQLADHLGQRAHRLYDLSLPAFCGDTDFVDCARALQGRRAVGYTARVELFRHKAALVELLGHHLDDLEAPEAKAYMTCRAVRAARLDFDATDESLNENRGEARRRAEQFFRIEASVGID